jgi:hypothetical protein
MRKIKLFILVVVIGLAGNVTAQNFSSHYSKEGLKVYLNSDSTHYIKATGLAQVWLRYNSNNPGSAINGTPRANDFDAGLRRVRYQTMAQLTDKVFFYTQFGINSSNSISARKPQLFFHDVTAEYAIYKNYFTVGAGLSGWNGTARFASSSVGSILGMDLPYVEETTNDVADQFVRKLGVYVKGKIAGFDYRVSVSNPYPVQTATTISIGQAAVAGLPAVPAVTANATTKDAALNQAYFSTRAPGANIQGYFMWQFLDKESNQTPYMNGSYLGKKRIFNIGAGFEYQQNAMVYRQSSGDTSMKFVPLKQFGLDLFYDYYLNKEKQNAVTAYVAFLNYNFGPNYIRNNAAMNTANGGVLANSIGSYGGTGNSFPLIGTGNVLYAQVAYIFRKDLLGKQGTLQPYAQMIYAKYDRLQDPMKVYDVGVNWIIAGQNSKISLDYQSRPIYNQSASTGDITEVKSARRGQVVLQYQVTF